MQRSRIGRSKIRKASAALVVAALVAAPAIPAAATELPANSVDGLWATGQSIAAVPAEATDSGLDLLAADNAPKYDYQVYYLDGLGDDWYNNGTMRYMYVRTDNPEADFKFDIDTSKATYITALQEGQLLDVEDLGWSANCLRVTGGYIIAQAFETDSTGPQTIKLYEKDGSRYALAATFTANFIDYDDARDEWVDEVIAKYTNTTMNPLEKMQAISSGLYKVFTYPPNYQGRLASLATRPSEPFFVTERWDSLTSPTMLCLIAERIGGFDEIVNCYFAYEPGSADWHNYHAWCRVTYKGETAWCLACPPISTGTVNPNTTEKIDFGNLNSPVFDAPRDFKVSEATQPAEYSISVVSPHGSVHLTRGYTAVFGENVSFTMAPDKGYEVSSVSIATAHGREVKAYGSGDARSFTMPDGDIVITVEYRAMADDEAAQPIDVIETANCSVQHPIEAKPGTEVTLYVHVYDGCSLDADGITVLDDHDNPIAVTDLGNGDYSFIMPEGPVSVRCMATKDTADDENEPDDENKPGDEANPGDENTPGDEGEPGDEEAPDDEGAPDDETPDYNLQQFSDIDDDAWYYESVGWAVENGIMRGYAGTDRFGPDDTITRAQMAGVLYNIAGNPEVDPTVMNRFSDCESGAWYDDAVSWAIQQGIFSGYEGTDKFGPEDPITREQIAVVLWRQAGEPVGSGNLSGFPDGANTSSWASNAMSWAVDTGLFLGDDSTGELNPVDNLTRAQAAAIMMRKSAELR